MDIGVWISEYGSRSMDLVLPTSRHTQSGTDPHTRTKWHVTVRDMPEHTWISAMLHIKGCVNIDTRDNNIISEWRWIIQTL